MIGNSDYLKKKHIQTTANRREKNITITFRSLKWNHYLYLCNSFYSQNHRMVGVGRDLCGSF